MRDAQCAPMMHFAPHEVEVLEESYRSGDVIAGKYPLAWQAQQNGKCHLCLAVQEALDFGIVKANSEGLRARVLDTNATGTVGYMAPEQAFAHEGLDHRADIWAFCAVLYEVISGSTPLSSESFDDMQRSHVQDAISPLTRSSGVDGALWAILERGLHVDPNERWSSMHELGQGLA